MKTLTSLIFSLFISTVFTFLSFADSSNEKPSLLLANVYKDSIDVKNYWISEKYDGVRALWTGEKLVSRQGTVFNPPNWFIANLPKTPLDGELWLERQNFSRLSGIVRTQEPVDRDWEKVKFMIFDLPDHKGIFTERLESLNALIDSSNIPWLIAVRQWRINNHQELNQQLKDFSSKGAEGLMLHRADSYYHSNRSNDLLKLKLYQDAEASVIKHLPGKGLFEGMMGSILVEMSENKRFKIGTGFTNEERLNPPKIGSIITFQYNGFTKTGLPRFARFLHVREPPK